MIFLVLFIIYIAWFNKFNIFVFLFQEVDVLYEEDKKQQLLNEALVAQTQAVNKVSSSDMTMQQYDQSGAPTVGKMVYFST